MVPKVFKPLKFYCSLQFRGVLLIWIIERQGPTVIVVGAGGFLGIFALLYHTRSTHQLELTLSRKSFDGSKGVRAIEVLLYLFSFTCACFFSIPNPLCFQNFAHVNEALGSARADTLTDMPSGPVSCARGQSIYSSVVTIQIPKFSSTHFWLICLMILVSHLS